MKTRSWKWVALFFLMVGGTAVMAQNADVPGDNFSLEGALELFKKSQSPEEFEKMLNSEQSKVNNLDLNGDGYIDYIRVINRKDGHVHTFTMQALVADNEVQDVAVIVLEKKANGKAVLQIIGDEDVYGIETIIEPTQEVRVNAGATTTNAVVNVWTWPAVQYVYSPGYVVWISPWTWTIRPVWWYGWHPVVYYRYDLWWRPYRAYYVRCYTPRIVYAHRIYRPYRATSVIVHRRHEAQLTRYRTAHRTEYERSRNRYSETRYANSVWNDRQRDVRSTQVRTRPTEEFMRDRSGVRTARATERRPESAPAVRQREGKPAERTVQRNERNTMERTAPAKTDRSVTRPGTQRMKVDQPRQQTPRMSGGSNRSSQPRVNNSDRGSRASEKTSPRSGRSGNRKPGN